MFVLSPNPWTRFCGKLLILDRQTYSFFRAKNWAVASCFKPSKTGVLRLESHRTSGSLELLNKMWLEGIVIPCQNPRRPALSVSHRPPYRKPFTPGRVAAATLTFTQQHPHPHQSLSSSPSSESATSTSSSKNNAIITTTRIQPVDLCLAKLGGDMRKTKPSSLRDDVAKPFQEMELLCWHGQLDDSLEFSLDPGKHPGMRMQVQKNTSFKPNIHPPCANSGQT